MKSADIRKDFLDFFRSKGHTIIPSASLIPENDPTLLFTNAGMNQFKDVFLGIGKRDYVRAADTQKCMRVSGKHNDLEDVGKDTYHHTFFEMLGNWSFGDYYKREAIEWAWELLTRVWNLPKDKLYATVHHTDDEAFLLWKEVTDIDKAHILKFGDKDNFWEMGATGPCGPCSEIHIDRGEEACDKKGVKGHVCGVNAGCARYIELWNLVFIQYNRGEDGKLETLPNKHVDTGMGFERIVSVLQNKQSNYDTDLFLPLIRRVEDLSAQRYNEGKGMPFRVIADHIRSLTFAMADGVMPSNEGRGYVIRKILRRAIRYGKRLGFEEPFLHKIVDVLVDVMGRAFPELSEKREMVKSLIYSEEESFFRTLNRGLDKLNEIVEEAKAKDRIISGDHLFMLYDSLGFPLDFVQHVAEDESLTIDMKRFEELMEEQKNRARASWKGEGFDFKIVSGVKESSVYTGEEKYEDEGIIQLLVSGDRLVESVSGNDEVVLIINKTPFYPEKGGQVGDVGVIEKGEAKIAIRNTRLYEDTILHYGVVVNGVFKKGDKVLLRVERERKEATARNHTATHIIHKALRNVVGEHAEQAGSLVGPERLRFDYTHSKALNMEEIERIENEANRIVLQNLPVKISSMKKEEAIKSGAMAIFEEKYGEVVRVIEIGDYSKELCGGTHVKRTGDIGLIKIISESSISAGTRRLEATTGFNSLLTFREYFHRSKEIASILNSEETKIADRVTQIIDSSKQKEKEIIELKKQLIRSGIEKWIQEAVNMKNSTVIIRRADLSADEMVVAVDEFKEKVKDGVIFLIGEPSPDKVSITAGVTRSLVSKVKAGDLAREAAKVVGGGGGGRPDFAQAGGRHTSRIKQAIEKAREIIYRALEEKIEKR